MTLMKISFNESEADIIYHWFTGPHEENILFVQKKYL